MARLRPLPPRKVIEILEKLGFQRVRQKGSHLFLRHPDGRTTLVPTHKKDASWKQKPSCTVWFGAPFRWNRIGQTDS